MAFCKDYAYNKKDDRFHQLEKLKPGNVVYQFKLLQYLSFNHLKNGIRRTACDVRRSNHLLSSREGPGVGSWCGMRRASASWRSGMLRGACGVRTGGSIILTRAEILTHLLCDRFHADN
jgi:hypothetical protein